MELGDAGDPDGRRVMGGSGLGIGFGRRRRDLDRGETGGGWCVLGERGIGLLLGFGLGCYDLRGE